MSLHWKDAESAIVVSLNLRLNENQFVKFFSENEIFFGH